MNKNSYNPRQNNQYNQYNQNNPNKPIVNSSNTRTEFKPKNYNGIFIALLTILYILFINKISEMLCSANTDDEGKVSSYVMTVYFISIMGLVIAYVWITEQNNGNYVLRKSLTYGGITMLLYTILNYWEYLDDYAKLIMLALSISCIVYYAY
jgi:hypothetical protein